MSLLITRVMKNIKKSHFLYLVLLGIALLTSCKPAGVVQEKNNNIDCYSDDVINSYRNLIDNSLMNVVKSRLETSNGLPVEIKYVQDGFRGSKVVLESISSQTIATSNSCRARLSVTLPRDVWETAQQFSPLLYSPNRYETELNSAANANLILRKDTTLIQTVNYTVTKSNEQIKVDADEIELMRISQTLGVALLPFAIKDYVDIGGVAVARNDVLDDVQRPVADDDESTPIINTLPESEHIDIKDNSKQDDSIEVLQQEFTEAQRELSAKWGRLDETVRDSLMNEQSHWRDSLIARCNQKDTVKRLQCSINQTRERISYLQDFSID